MKLVGLARSLSNYSLAPICEGLTFTATARFGKFNCDSCSKHLSVPQCRACDRMVNYFKVFQIPQNYKIDPEAVRVMARDLQREFHPDRCGEGTGLMEKMQKYSSYINEAKATLLNDLQRAVYLMGLKGMEEQEGMEIKETAFLGQMFELQQEIEEANLQQAKGIVARLEGVLREVQKELQVFFTSDDLDHCRQFVAKYKYVSSALVNAKQKVASLQEAQQV